LKAAAAVEVVVVAVTVGSCLINYLVGYAAV